MTETPTGVKGGTAGKGAVPPFGPQKGGMAAKRRAIRERCARITLAESEEAMKDKREPLKKPAHIAAVLRKAIAAYRDGGDGELVKVWELWEGAVGPAIAENTRAAAFRGNLLIVHVSSSTWIHHLHFLKPDLIATINRALGKPLVKEIKFKVGPL